MRKLSSKPAVYALKRTEVKLHTIPENITNHITDTLFVAGKCPTRFVIGFTRASYFNGDKHFSPFDYRSRFPKDPANQHGDQGLETFYIKSVRITFDGQASCLTSSGTFVVTISFF